MNKILIVGIIQFISMSLNAQTWFDLGLKGGFGAGFLINKTINTDSRFDVLPQRNYFYGGKVGVNFGEKIGFTIDVDYGAYAYGFTQAKVPGYDQSKTYKYKLSYNSVNVLPTFRYTNEASYLELGYQFSILKNQLIDDEISSNEPADILSKNAQQLVFGFGGYMLGNEVIALSMGLRFMYGISDLTADSYRNTTFPFTKYNDISSHSDLNRLNTQLVLELNYSLGYIVRASCGRRTAFLSF
jgi:hypothetical protein